MCSSRNILLVGEGNFSFSASVSQLYSETNITATCLQHQDEALRHEGAATNIQTVQDSGGELIFGVDCTKLAECASLQGREFDRVVFNFPHCGRKSGVKKNRELLKNFFLSCVQLLSEDGEVHVSLCNGQGGTPADHPKREWHNSWQVVAMAAEAHLILSHVHSFESDKYQSYKCTGYRSQDKGFHVEKGLLHVFTRSLPFSPAQTLQVEEAVKRHRVEYNITAELSDYIFRGLLCTGSVHPVRMVQDFLLKGLADKWSISMTTETVPFLLTAEQLQASCPDIKSTDCCWIHLLQKHQNCDAHTSKNIEKDPVLDSQGHTDTLPATCATSDKVRIKEAESLMSACSLVDPDSESCLYVLRPSLLPHMEELLTKKLINNAGRHGENEGNNTSVEGHKKEGPFGVSNGVTSLLFGLSGLVFKNVPVNLWAPPAFHELLLRGIFPSERVPMKLLGQRLEELLAPYGVSLVTEQGGLRLIAQPMGLVGRVFASDEGDNISDVCVTVSLNLDLLAVLLFSLPDWRLLWSHDPRFIQHFELCPSPGKPFQPFSLYPETFSFDISFWTGPTWNERKFHAVIREASHGTVEQVKLIDTFSHPDLSQTSYCYRLIYHSYTHALSHTQALHFHKDLETFLTSRLQVTIR
ncbi:ferredoxin-fold anticodon-binding domain-containing protein 1 isoform X1 [Pseudochaenichthys georgianus]|uniref:ferredoxin-fold anticodon-binding domain-containing protein 1 isoform X1 n=1 Tax=Pseudochaenichthys georgianus TaxID=52239 RepID=UPI00146F550E|nr:ferredoxin-fold anticodon-binding domain-containing protein 1 [Pseudochaenichthys georgianus]